MMHGRPCDVQTVKTVLCFFRYSRSPRMNSRAMISHTIYFNGFIHFLTAYTAQMLIRGKMFK